MEASEVNDAPEESSVSVEVINKDTSSDVANVCEPRIEGVSEECQMEVEEHNLSADNLTKSVQCTKSSNADSCCKFAQVGLTATSVISSETCLKEGECFEEHFQNMNVDNSELQTECATSAISNDEGVNSENGKVVTTVSDSINNANSDLMASGDSCHSESQEVIQPLEYIFANARHITEAWTDFAYRQDGECFLKGCKWSPDGTCLLSNSEDNILRLFELPVNMYNRRTFDDSLLSLSELTSVLRKKEGGLIYDYCWYPLMSSLDPESCCFMSTTSGSPIHLWDAYTGKLQATYRAYDNVDEVMSSMSITFNPSGTRIYSGFKNCIKIFNTAVPGRDCDTINTKADQPGIVSCIAVNPAMEDVFAIGTFQKTVGLYTCYGDIVCILKGQSGGLTQLMFSPDGNLLYTGARKDNEILCWDLRNTEDVLFVLNRVVTTNQRIYFDITQDGKYLVSGSTDGIVRVWDVDSTQPVDDQQTVAPVIQWKAHNDCVNGLSIHKQIPVIATSSGQRHKSEIVDDDDDDDDESDRLLIRKIDMDKKEDMIKLWWCGPNKPSDTGLT